MLLIRRVRHFTPAGESEPRKYETGFDPGLEVGTLPQLLRNLDSVLKQIPEKERWNCYYTQGASERGEGQERTWRHQTLLPFDVDGITVRGSGLAGEFDPRYLEVFFATVGVDPDKTAVVYSGNGLHFLVEMSQRVQNRDWFDKHRVGYETLVQLLNEAYATAGLAGAFDMAVFAPNRILRLPGTVNRKPGREDRLARIVQGRLEAQAVTPCGLAGIPEVKPAHALGAREMASFVIDTPAVEAGCGFLQWAKRSPAELSEPAWYALLSVVGRLAGGEAKAQEYSAGHPTYNAERTARKLRQSVAASGPRTCDNISTLWGGCAACPHRHRVASPVSIRGDKFIATEETGFHTVNAKGQLLPDYSGLATYLDRETGYATSNATGSVFFHNGTHFERQNDISMRGYAQDHFKPAPKDAMRKEFESFLKATNRKPHEFFTAGTSGKVNLKNGVLDLATKTLSPHTREFGFLQVLPFDFEPKAMAPRFESFLREVTCSDKDLAELLLEFIGFILCDRDYAFQKCLVMVGHGSNGKSTMLEVMKALLGRSSYSILTVSEMQDATGRLPLENSLANISDEMPPHAMKTTDLMKKLTGGETTMRALYHNAATMRNMAKFVFSCNEIGQTQDNSHGFYRRLVIAPFNAHFELQKNAELDILKKLKAELSGIFNMALLAYDRLMARGNFPESAAATEALAEYRGDNDLIGSWVADNLTFDDSHTAQSLRNIYAKFSSDMHASGHKPISQTALTKGLRRIVPNFEKRMKQARANGTVERCLHGVKFGADAPTPPAF